MKLTTKEIRDLLGASYIKDRVNVGRFQIDEEISNHRVRVYTVPDSDDVIVTHRGSTNNRDWVDNFTFGAFNALKSTSTYKTHLRVQKKAVKKYGKQNIVVLGHSRAGLYAKQFYEDNLANQVITFNKPVNLYDVAKNTIKPKKDDENEIIIRTENDAVSIGQKLLKDNKTDVIIPSKTINPLTEHSTDTLGNLDENQLLGNGK
ncbi:unnamed protein product, partial [Ectocarpus fasciculatus]